MFSPFTGLQHNLLHKSYRETKILIRKKFEP